MIPYRLRLYNFLCYRGEHALDFSGIHLACLAGDNGAGKSTLLDAMTWALWGKARARRDEELITLGETEMWVDFEFEFGPQRYRAWRQRTRKGRGQGDLHFWVWNDSAGDWQLLDAGNQAERQAQIIDTLRMQYDTFVNSAFLLQGRADSFTTKTPGDRKQILADILGLDRYDRYEERAKERARESKTRAERIQGEIDGIDHELGQRPTYEAQLELARTRMKAATQAREAAEDRRAGAQMAVKALEGQEQQLTDLRGRLARAERDLGEVRRQLEVVRGRVSAFENVLEHRAEVEAGWQALMEAREADAAWNERLARRSAFEERVTRLRVAIGSQRSALEADQRHLAERMQSLAKRINTGKEQARLIEQIETILAGFEKQQARRDELARELTQVGERGAALKTENERLRTEAQGLTERGDLLRQAETAACPVCGQPLDAQHRDEVLAGLAAERDEMAARFRANNAEMKQLAEARSRLENEDATLARDLRSRDARQRQMATAEAGKNDGLAAEAELAAAQAEMEEVARRLKTHDYATAEQAELARLEAEVAQVAYDKAAHQAVKQQLADLAQFDTAYQRQLLPALEGIDETRAQAASLAEQEARRDAELREDQARAAELGQQLAKLPEYREMHRRAQQAWLEATDEERRAQQQEGAANQQLKALATLAERRATLAASLDATNDEVSLYNQLREAFGKRGLQAMIIESAIPEVEAEANQLLNRMSEGRMSLRLETQREKVTGGVAETLDIIISDELGARAYEMYSGGEAFRANLALRIAISKLLARRAGAQLQTLVIDEGFGTQDAQGRSLLVEAISSIQHDFARVLVVTHIEELKDLFPARIDVVKTAAGSQVSIN